MDTQKKRTIYLGAAIFVGLIILWGMFREAPVKVETAATKRGRMVVTVDAEGKTRVRDKFTVTAPISGMMARIKLSEGDNIFRNHPIAEIDPNPPIQTVPVAPREVNPYAARVFAPVAGRVLRVFDKSERFVTAGTPILELGNPDNIEIVVDILSTEAIHIRPGATILVEDEHRAEPIKARVRLVESQAVTKVSALGVEEQRVNVIGDFLHRKDTFGDNFRVNVRIVTWEGNGVLTIPSSSLFRTDEDWSVFVVERGKARRRIVVIGQRNADDTQILDGISEGETVILHPPKQLDDGRSVASY